MRNLKKVLALVLVMALSLTMFAGATTTFTDVTSDTVSPAQQDAITVLSTLGVINGYPGGDFKPEGIVTRAELAKMLYVIKTGDPSATFYGNADLSKVFKDYIEDWAVPFVNYAYLNGIMVGYGDGTVRANEQVSGVEAAKMALVALGYLPKTEGLEGENYYNNTVRLASVAGLLKNLGTANMSEGLTRADTAVLLYNALYANTVQYVGGAATPKTEALSSTDTITLGEEGFNLLDVTGVLVANDQAALSAYWPNVLSTANNVATTQLVGYRTYSIAASNQSRFVYRDYTGAASSTGTYTDRVVTVNIDTDFAQLGHSYRMLITKPSNSTYSSTEVRTCYGILGEAGSATVKETTVGDQSTAVLSNMITRYNLDKAAIAQVTYGSDNASALGKNANVPDNPATPAVDESIVDGTDGTILINGAVKSFGAAKAALNKASTAKVTYIDNDSDGTADSLFIEDYTLGYVNGVTDTNIVILGAGSIAKTSVSLTNGDVAQGDYVMWYKNAADAKYYVKKLDVVSGNVTGYDGSKYTINGAQYTLGTGADASLLNGYNSVNSTIYSFVVDGSYIVKASVSGETSFQKYAVVKAVDDAVYGYPQVTLYTEDNTTLYGSLASVDGIQTIYYPGTSTTGLAGTLVSYVQDGNNFYLTKASSSVTYIGTENLAYTANTDVWSNTNSYKNESGVVFVTIDNGTNIRAYKNGQFIPGKDIAVGTSDPDAVIYADSPFGIKYIKAAYVKADSSQLPNLPGIISNASSNIIATVLGVANVTSDASGYTYSYSIASPWSGSAQTVTLVPSVAPIEQLTKGNIYRLFLNADGKVERFELLFSVDPVTTGYDSVNNVLNFASGYTDNGYVSATNSYGTNLTVAKITSMYIDLNGQVSLTTEGNGYFTLGQDANVFFISKLGTTSIGSVNWLTLTNNGQPLPTLTGYKAFIEYNAQTGAIANIWIDTAAPTITVAP